MTNVGRLLRAKVDALIAETAMGAVSGSVKDTEALHFTIGFVAGMREVISRLEEIEREG